MTPFRISARIVRGSLLAVVAPIALLAGCSSSGGGLQPPSGLHYANNSPTYSVSAPITPDVPSVGGGAVSSWSVSPTLPAGLRLDPSTGTIQGTPTATAATLTYTVTAANDAGSAKAGLAITVTSAVTPPSGLHYSSNGVVYTVGAAITPNTPTTSGGQPTSYTVTPALPAGLSMAGTTGIITGTPTAAAALTTYTVQAANAGGSTSVGLVFTVSTAVQPPLILRYTSNSPSYVVGTPVMNAPTVTGGQPTGYTLNRALPAGLSLNSTTGVISGTPTTPVTAATCVVTASNSAGSAQVTLSITVTSSVTAPGSITYAMPSHSYPAGQAIQQNAPTVTGGQPTSWSVTPPLPAGFTLNPTTGVVSGTPSTPAAAANYVVTGSNSAGSAAATLNVTVTRSFGQLALLVNGQPVTSATVSLPYTAVGSGPYTIKLKGLLYQSGGVTSGTQAFINFADNATGATFGPGSAPPAALQCQVTSEQNECVMIVNLPSASPLKTYQVNVTMAGAVTTLYGGYNSIVVNLTPDTTPGPGSIKLSTQTAQVPIGLNAPLWVTWDGPATIGTVTVNLAISGGASFYWYNPGDNLTRHIGTTKTCTLTFTGAADSSLHCGYGLRANDGATASQPVTLTATASGSWGYTYPTQTLPLTVGAALPAARTVTFTNGSSQPLWVGITGGAATSWSDEDTPYGAPGSTSGGRPIGGTTQCGPSTTPPDAAACPLGTTCLQGGRNLTTGGEFDCFYDQGTLSSYGLLPGDSTTFQISGSSVSPSGILWSGNFYGRTGCNTTDPTQIGVCQNATCVGAVPGFACGPGTGPSPGANTLAEVTFQTNGQPDYYDVSIINGANFAVQFAPQGVNGTGYICGSPGSGGAQAGGLPAANWTQVVSSSNFPVPGNLRGDPTSFFQLVSPLATQTCPANGICPTATDACGFRPTDLNGTFDFTTRYCGTKIGWTTADGMFGANQTNTPTTTPFGFTLTPSSPPSPLPVPTVVPSVGQLQLCTSPAVSIYSSYTLNWNSPTSAQQFVAWACGGVMWGATEVPGPNMPQPTNTGLNIITPAQPVQTVNPNWLTYVLPTIEWMKQACPTCYTYPFDDMSSTFTCADSTGLGLNYAVQFSDLK